MKLELIFVAEGHTWVIRGRPPVCALCGDTGVLLTPVDNPKLRLARHWLSEHEDYADTPTPLYEAVAAYVAREEETLP